MIGLGSNKNTIFDVYIRLIQNGCKCQTAIYEDFFNVLCTSSMYSSSSSNSSFSASVIFDLAVAFSCWQWENLISGESRALGFPPWFHPRSCLSTISSHIFSLLDSNVSDTLQHHRVGTASSIIKHLLLKPCYGPFWLSAQANKGWAKMEAWIQFKFN